jgi:hypothetical protein
LINSSIYYKLEKDAFLLQKGGCMQIRCRTTKVMQIYVKWMPVLLFLGVAIFIFLMSHSLLFFEKEEKEDYVGYLHRARNMSKILLFLSLAYLFLVYILDVLFRYVLGERSESKRSSSSRIINPFDS